MDAELGQLLKQAQQVGALGNDAELSALIDQAHSAGLFDDAPSGPKSPGVMPGSTPQNIPLTDGSYNTAPTPGGYYSDIRQNANNFANYNSSAIDDPFGQSNGAEKGQGEASVTQLAASTWAPDQQKKVDYLSSALGVSPDTFHETPQGLAYVKDGKQYLVNQSDLASFMGNMAGRDAPANALATAGSLFGPAGTAGGASIGELWRQDLAGEQANITQAAKIGAQYGIGDKIMRVGGKVVGDAVGEVVGGLRNASSPVDTSVIGEYGANANRMTPQAKTPIPTDRALEAQQAQKYGINVNAPDWVDPGDGKYVLTQSINQSALDAPPIPGLSPEYRVADGARQAEKAVKSQLTFESPGENVVNDLAQQAKNAQANNSAKFKPVQDLAEQLGDVPLTNYRATAARLLDEEAKKGTAADQSKMIWLRRHAENGNVDFKSAQNIKQDLDAEAISINKGNAQTLRDARAAKALSNAARSDIAEFAKKFGFHDEYAAANADFEQNVLPYRHKDILATMNNPYSDESLSRMLQNTKFGGEDRAKALTDLLSGDGKEAVKQAIFKRGLDAATKERGLFNTKAFYDEVQNIGKGASASLDSDSKAFVRLMGRMNSAAKVASKLNDSSPSAIKPDWWRQGKGLVAAPMVQAANWMLLTKAGKRALANATRLPPDAPIAAYEGIFKDMPGDPIGKMGEPVNTPLGPKWPNGKRTYKPTPQGEYIGPEGGASSQQSAKGETINGQYAKVKPQRERLTQQPEPETIDSTWTPPRALPGLNRPKLTGPKGEGLPAPGKETGAAQWDINGKRVQGQGTADYEWMKRNKQPKPLPDDKQAVTQQKPITMVNKDKAIVTVSESTTQSGKWKIDRASMKNGMSEGRIDTKGKASGHEDATTLFDSRAEAMAAAKKAGYEWKPLKDLSKQEPAEKRLNTLLKNLTKPQGKAKPLAKVKADRGKVDEQNDHMGQIIAKLGGIDSSTAALEGIDRAAFRDMKMNMPVGGKPGLRVFKKGGKTVDEMAELLADRGLITLGKGGKPDARAVLDMIDKISRGEKPRPWTTGDDVYEKLAKAREDDQAMYDAYHENTHEIGNLLDDSYYHSDSSSARSLTDMYEAAKAIDADEADAIMGSQASDADVAIKLAKMLRGQ